MVMVIMTVPTEFELDAPVPVGPDGLSLRPHHLRRLRATGPGPGRLPCRAPVQRRRVSGKTGPVHRRCHVLRVLAVISPLTEKVGRTTDEVSTVVFLTSRTRQGKHMPRCNPQRRTLPRHLRLRAGELLLPDTAVKRPVFLCGVAPGPVEHGSLLPTVRGGILSCLQQAGTRPAKIIVVSQIQRRGHRLGHPPACNALPGRVVRARIHVMECGKAPKGLVLLRRIGQHQRVAALIVHEVIVDTFMLH